MYSARALRVGAREASWKCIYISGRRPSNPIDDILMMISQDETFIDFYRFDWTMPSGLLLSLTILAGRILRNKCTQTMQVGLFDTSLQLYTSYYILYIVLID